MGYNRKTTYSIRDVSGIQSTITIDKLDADVLQQVLTNVHDWIQTAYYRVSEKKPELSRRKKGDLVRLLAKREAEKSPLYKQMSFNLFGL